MSSYSDALAQSEVLEDVSDENLIHYFMPELVLIESGKRATDLLPVSVISSFIRIGVFINNKGPKNYTLSDKALNIIQEGS